MARRWLWLQDYSAGGSTLYTQAGIDAAVAANSGKFTDLMLAQRLDNDARS